MGYGDGCTPVMLRYRYVLWLITTATVTTRVHLSRPSFKKTLLGYRINVWNITFVDKSYSISNPESRLCQSKLPHLALSSRACKCASPPCSAQWPTADASSSLRLQTGRPSRHQDRLLFGNERTRIATALSKVRLSSRSS